MIELLEKAKILSEALPYFKKFNGKNIVIKYGGSAMIDDEMRKNVINDIILMKYVGINPIVVHGGGKHVTNMMQRLGKEAKFLKGHRVTDKETMDITEMVLAGQINKGIVALIHTHGARAVGLSGKDGKLIEAKKKEHEDGTDFGYVGEIERINPDIITVLESNGFIPVISPIGINEKGETFNINADSVAYAIAEELKAEKLIFLTDVNGVLKDPEDSESVISSLDKDDIKRYSDEGIISGGMLPKLAKAVQTLKKGVDKIHIINGMIPHAMLLEVFTRGGIGTQIVLEGKNNE